MLGEGVWVGEGRCGNWFGTWAQPPLSVGFGLTVQVPSRLRIISRSGGGIVGISCSSVLFSWFSGCFFVSWIEFPCMCISPRYFIS